MGAKFRVGIGTHFMLDGQQHTVVAIRDGLLETRDAHGKIVLLAPGELHEYPDFRQVDHSESETSFPLPDLDADTLKKAMQLERHLREALTGSPSSYGHPDPSAPRDGYDPHETTLSKRISLKAAELNVTERSLWNYKDSYEAYGLVGLVDQRTHRSRTPFKKIDARVKEATNKVLNSVKRESRLSKLAIRKRIATQLKRDYKEEIALPSVATLNRYIQMVGEPLGVFNTAKQRKFADSRDRGPRQLMFGHFEANRPGQVVLIDSTVLNNFALDELTGKWVQVQLTIAVDLYTRSIVAWRLAPTVPSVDVALLLYEMLSPKRSETRWHNSTRQFYFGIPEEVVFCLESDVAATAKVPAIFPETVLVDHGRVFVSEAFRQACLLLGISVQYARRHAPTDKAVVENVFDFIKEHFCAELPGFTGADIASRGVDIESKAAYFIGEIAEKFAEWVATEWQQRDHRGLFLPGTPHLELSPNDLYKEGLARAGFVYTVPNATLYYELLPSAWRKVVETGVSIDGLFYDHERLHDYRGIASSYGGKEVGKYPIRFDQRNLLEVFFFDYLASPPQWIALRWRGARSNTMPFNDRAVAYAKDLCLQRLLNPRDPKVLGAALLYLLDRWDQQLYDTQKERKALVKRALNAVAVTRDRARMNTPFAAPDEEVEHEWLDDMTNLEILDAYIDEAKTQPIGDEHDSTYDF